MDIFNVITLFGGLAFFLYGMHVLSNGLEKIAGGKLEKTLKKMTSNPIKSLALGAGITVAIQSSSAMTVMLVGLVNSGIMELGQTIGVIMGSNIGTTFTAWILSLAGIESSNIFIKLLKPESFSPIIALIGIIFIMMSKSTKKKDIGTIMVGFAILMSGMQFMSGAVSPLRDIPEFQSILTFFKNPLLGVAVGAIFTGIIQSSAASVGILQALSLTGGLSYEMAMPIIMGQNIGTCVTSLISSIGVNKNAKRVAAVHIYFNVIGTIFCLIVFYGLNAIFSFKFMDRVISPFGIATVHTIFNLITTALLLPFTKQLEKLARMTIKDTKNKNIGYQLLDERLLQSPSFAIAECQNITIKMSELAKSSLLGAISLVENYNEKIADEITQHESSLDMYEDKLGSYLVKLSGKELSDADSREISKLLHTIGDFERIGDHAVNILRVAKELHTKEVYFSEKAIKELQVVTQAISEILSLTTDAFRKNSVELAFRVEPLEQVIDGLISEVKGRHVRRLQEGKCTIELGFILSDLLTNYERVSDHCSNIAVCLIQIKASAYNTHLYLNDIKTSGQPEFVKAFEEYNAKYTL